MLKLLDETRVFINKSPTDMRCSFDKLTEMVREHMRIKVTAGGWYVFFSRGRDKCKILYWDDDGYALWYKRLEAGTFKIKNEEGHEEITGVDLSLLLKGMDLSRIKIRKKVKDCVFKTA